MNNLKVNIYKENDKKKGNLKECKSKIQCTWHFLLFECQCQFPKFDFLILGGSYRKMETKKNPLLLRYGWRNFRPGYLQFMNNSKCFLLFATAFSISQGAFKIRSRLMKYLLII